MDVDTLLGEDVQFHTVVGTHAGVQGLAVHTGARHDLVLLLAAVLGQDGQDGWGQQDAVQHVDHAIGGQHIYPLQWDSLGSQQDAPLLRDVHSQDLVRHGEDPTFGDELLNSQLAMVVDMVPHQLLQFRETRCEEVDQAAVTQAVHSLIAWDKDCEGPRSVQDGRQPTVLQDGFKAAEGLGRGEDLTNSSLGIPWGPRGGLPPQASDHVEDAIGCYVVGLVDVERLLGLVFVLVGVFRELVEGDGYLLPGQRPPLSCLLGPCVLQDVLPCDDVLSAELLGKGCVHGPGGEGGDGWHQHGERACCGEDLPAALVHHGHGDPQLQEHPACLSSLLHLMEQVSVAGTPIPHLALPAHTAGLPISGHLAGGRPVTGEGGAEGEAARRSIAVDADQAWPAGAEGLAWLLVHTQGRVAGAATKVVSAWVLGQTHYPIAMVVLGAVTLSLPLGAHRAQGQR